MSIKYLVAYSTIPDMLDIIYIPDNIFLQDGTKYIKKSLCDNKEISCKEYDLMVKNYEIITILPKVIWKNSKFLLIEKSKFTILPIESEKQIRIDKANELVNRAMLITKKPEISFKLLRAAGNLMNIPLNDFISKLESFRNTQEEHLTDIFDRTRSNFD
ncbi:MAG TPA: hypothetical protein ENI61_06550 [Ignavibacteria bacterium]|nr:hypothetical protein [Ignavibacteria bacterium]